ncbi:zf-HC2 domain-containing protein [Lujinxingia litoralis]|nr:zf-HC2 domain-containing protein [Lujinxingia litoralis]
MKCQKLVDLLTDYLEGDLEEEERAHLEEHLAYCPPCVDFLQRYKNTGPACKKVLIARMPDSMQQALSDFLRSRLDSPDSSRD